MPRFLYGQEEISESRSDTKVKETSAQIISNNLIGNNLVNISAASYATIVVNRFFPMQFLGITTGL
jgi:Mg2+/Co2+ transporter CorB